MFPNFSNLTEQNRLRKLVMFTKMWDLVMQQLLKVFCLPLSNVKKDDFLQYAHDDKSLVLTIPFLNPGDTPEHERLTASKKFCMLFF